MMTTVIYLFRVAEDALDDWILGAEEDLRALFGSRIFTTVG